MGIIYLIALAAAIGIVLGVISVVKEHKRERAKGYKVAKGWYSDRYAETDRSVLTVKRTTRLSQTHLRQPRLSFLENNGRHRVCGQLELGANVAVPDDGGHLPIGGVHQDQNDLSAWIFEGDGIDLLAVFRGGDPPCAARDEL